MTVLPTVRQQICEAAEARAGGRATISVRRRRGITAVVVVPLGLGVALAVAVLALVLLSRAPSRPMPAPASAGSAAREVLQADGIANVRFGRPATAAITGIERALRLGRPATATTASSTGYQHFGCGFHQAFWIGLPEQPTRFVHSIGLTLYFRHSRFVGYVYGSPGGGSTTPIVRRGPRFATAQGLQLGASVDRARRLYGGALTLTMVMQGTPPNPRLERLPGWQAQTAQGRLFGWTGSMRRPNSTFHRTIGTIDAGAVPNTPCR